MHKNIDFISGVPFNSTEALHQIAKTVGGTYFLLYTKPHPLEMGEFAVERMTAVADDMSADMVYADHYELIIGDDGKEVRRRHPLIECQKGALRNDFDFGSVLLFRTSSFKEAVAAMDKDWN